MAFNMLHLEHTRYLTQLWQRDPKGRYLKKDTEVPWGNRTPNNLIWGHTLNDFFYIERQYGLRVFSIWSRSMIKAFGENYHHIEHEEEPTPRKLRPWPVLSILPLTEGETSVQANKEAKTLQREIGLVDETCKLNHMCQPQAVNDVNPATFIPKELDLDELRDSTPSKKPPAATIVPNVPRLEELIPYDFLPDVLVVTDPGRITLQYLNDYHNERFNKEEEENVKTDQGKVGTMDDIESKVDESTVTIAAGDEATSSAMPPSSHKPRTIRYRRLYPAPRSAGKEDKSVEYPMREAQLDFTNAPRLGVGHHSLVHQATFTVPKPLYALPHGKVTVAAKTAFNQHHVHADESAKELLQNEAEVYNKFPQQFMEHYCGYNIVPPIHYPVPIGAVVPKFFGYYVPEKGSSKHSPILLMEECGTPVEPEKLTPDQRTECFSLFVRFQLEEFIHNSTYVRNLLRQPGPLTVPPCARSDKTPSFRIIDFGRTTTSRGSVGGIQQRLRRNFIENDLELMTVRQRLMVTV